MSELRAEIAQRLGVVEEPSVRSKLDELRQRLRRIAPEILAGDEAANAQLAEIEQRIAEEQRRLELADLADAELQERERAAAEAELERQRAGWTEAKAKAEHDLLDELARVEKHLTALVGAISAAVDVDAEAARLGKLLDPQGGRRPVMRMIEERLTWRLRGDARVMDLPPRRGLIGSEPLASRPARTRRAAARGKAASGTEREHRSGEPGSVEE